MLMGNGAILPLRMRRSYGKEQRSEEHTSELQSRPHLVCRLLLEKKKELQLSRPAQTLPGNAHGRGGNHPRGIHRGPQLQEYMGNVQQARRWRSKKSPTTAARSSP